jgi:hypothetical protein
VDGLATLLARRDCNDKLLAEFVKALVGQPVFFSETVVFHQRLLFANLGAFDSQPRATQLQREIHNFSMVCEFEFHTFTFRRSNSDQRRSHHSAHLAPLDRNTHNAVR